MPTRAAVVVGLNYSTFPPGLAADVATRAGRSLLQFAEADAAALAALLQDRGDAVVSLLGPAATHAAILAALQTAVRAIGRDGRLIFYFAGHGEIDPYNAQAAYLLPADADPESLYLTALSLDDLARRYLGDSGSALALLDCCPAGPPPASGDPGAGGNPDCAFARAAQASFARVAQHQVLVACADSVAAREQARFAHGALTYHILDHWRANPQTDEDSLVYHVTAALAQDGLPSPLWDGGPAAPPLWDGGLAAPANPAMVAASPAPLPPASAPAPPAPAAPPVPPPPATPSGWTVLPPPGRGPAPGPPPGPRWGPPAMPPPAPPPRRTWRWAPAFVVSGIIAFGLALVLTCGLALVLTMRNQPAAPPRAPDIVVDRTATAGQRLAAVAAAATAEQRRAAALTTATAVRMAIVTGTAVAHATENAQVQAAFLAGQQAVTATAARATTTALAGRATLVATPAAGALPYGTGDLVATDAAGVDLRSLIVSARFLNPYDLQTGDWDYGFLFRSTGSDQQYRLIVTSATKWTLELVETNLAFATESPTSPPVDVDTPSATPPPATTFDVIAEGTVPQLDTGATGSNTLLLVVSGPTGWFFVNGDYVATLDVGGKLASGDVMIGSGFYQGDSVPNAVAHYQDFTIWSLP